MPATIVTANVDQASAIAATNTPNSSVLVIPNVSVVIRSDFVVQGFSGGTDLSVDTYVSA